MTRFATLLGLTLLFTLPVLAQADAAERERAMAVNPDAAKTLEGLVGEVATWKEELAADCGDACDRLEHELSSLAGSLDELWSVVARPEGKRELVDAAYAAILQRADGMERWLPQTEIEDANDAMRRWSGTRERIDRFKRTLRKISSEDA